MSSLAIQSLSDIPKDLKGFLELQAYLDDLKVRDLDAWIAAYRFLGEESLYFLLRRVLTLGTVVHNSLGVPVFDHDLYVDMSAATEYQIEQGKGVCTAARGTGKSELRSCAVPIKLFINYPDIAIGLYSVEKSYGLKHGYRLRTELSKNKMLPLLWPNIFFEDPNEVCKTMGVLFTNEALITKGRKMNRSVPSFEVNSLFGMGEIGSRYDVILLDDAEAEKYAATPNGVKELEAAISSASSLLTPVAIRKPVLLLTNTRFSQIGVTNRRHEKYFAEDPRLTFDVQAEIIEDHHTTKYVWNDEVGPLGGKISWPFTREILMQQYEEKPNKSEYVLQFCGSFRSVDERSLSETKLQHYHEEPEKRAENMTVYICIDPSRGVVDPSCFWVWGLSFDKMKFWLDATVRHLNPSEPEFIDQLCLLIYKWNKFSERVVEIRVEDVGPSTWSELIDRELRSRGISVRVVKCRVGVGSEEKKFATRKADRNWARWSPPLNRGEIWVPLPKSMKGRGLMRDMHGKGSMTDLVDYWTDRELIPFPNSISDNMLDAGGLLFDEKVNAEFPLQYGKNLNAERASRDWGMPHDDFFDESWMS